MNFHFIPPLQHMAAASIALRIYYDKDIEKMIEIHHTIPLVHDKGLVTHDQLEFLKLIEAKATEMLPSLPDYLKTRVSKFLRPLDYETIRWFQDHQFLEIDFGPMDCDPFIAYKNNLCWRTDGTIDKTQTAKKFASNKNFDRIKRFVMACVYFLEDKVLALWHGEGVSTMKIISRYGTNAAVRFWVQRLKRRSSRKIPWESGIDGYFKYLRIRQWDVRLRISCFFPYLSWDGKRNYLPYLRLMRGHSDDFVLCLRTMDEVEREEAISVHADKILLCFLRWPLQYLFMDVAKQLWSRMNVKHFDEMLHWIVDVFISHGFEEFDYVGLLKEFWNLGPASYKRKISKKKILFQMIEVTLNYDAKNAKLSMRETMQESMKDFETSRHL